MGTTASSQSLIETEAAPEIRDDAILTREERLNAARTLLYGDEDALRAALPRLNAKIIGRTRSPQKTLSSRENGKLGGRPPRVKTP